MALLEKENSQRFPQKNEKNTWQFCGLRYNNNRKRGKQHDHWNGTHHLHSDSRISCPPAYPHLGSVRSLHSALHSALRSVGVHLWLLVGTHPLGSGNTLFFTLKPGRPANVCSGPKFQYTTPVSICQEKIVQLLCQFYSPESLVSLNWLQKFSQTKHRLWTN